MPSINPDILPAPEYCALLCLAYSGTLAHTEDERTLERIMRTECNAAGVELDALLEEDELARFRLGRWLVAAPRRTHEERTGMRDVLTIVDEFGRRTASSKETLTERVAECLERARRGDWRSR